MKVMIESWQFWIVLAIVFIAGIWIATVTRSYLGYENEKYVPSFPTLQKKGKNYNKESSDSEEEVTYVEVSYEDVKTKRRSATMNNRDAIVSRSVTLTREGNYTPDVQEAISYKDLTPEIPEAIMNPEKRPYSKRKANEPRSKGEKACKKAAEEIYYPYKFYSTWPAWLINPETGRGLELDLYNEEIGVAIEFNGEFHYRYMPYFHKGGIKDFKAQVRRDNYKIDLCDQHGVWLITVPYNTPLDKIKEYISYYTEENCERRQRAKEAGQS